MIEPATRGRRENEGNGAISPRPSDAHRVTPARLRCWLVTSGEPIPSDGPDERLLRTGMLARALVERGHDVLWWTSAFDHQRKRMRRAVEQLDERPDLGVRLLPALGYGRNVSLARVRDHRHVARAFRSAALHEQPPDVIVASLPTIDLAAAAVDHGCAVRVPVLLDLRDQWPDAFPRLVPAAVRPLVRMALWPTRREVARIMAKATGLVGITETFLDWGLRYAGRERTGCDFVVPLACDARRPSEIQLEQARARWDRAGIRQGDSTATRLCFVGSLGRQIRFAPLLDALRRLRGTGIELVVCGDGENRAALAAAAADVPSVRFAGWASRAEIWELLRRSSCGLLPYAGDADFRASVPNKVIEYLSAGLPVLSTLQGQTATLLASEECGLTIASPTTADWEQAIRALVLNGDARAVASANACRVFAARFDAAVAFRRYASAIEEVVDRMAHTTASTR